MTNDEIIEMARQAGLAHFYDSEGHCTGITDADLVTADKEKNDIRLVEMLMPFAKLVEDKTRRDLREEIVYTWVPPHFVDIAVEAERNACAERAWKALISKGADWSVRQMVFEAINKKGET